MTIRLHPPLEPGRRWKVLGAWTVSLSIYIGIFRLTIVTAITNTISISDGTDKGCFAFVTRNTVELWSVRIRPGMTIGLFHPKGNNLRIKFRGGRVCIYMSHNEGPRVSCEASRFVGTQGSLRSREEGGGRFSREISGQVNEVSIVLGVDWMGCGCPTFALTVSIPLHSIHYYRYLPCLQTTRTPDASPQASNTAAPRQASCRSVRQQQPPPQQPQPP